MTTQNNSLAVALRTEDSSEARNANAPVFDVKNIEDFNRICNQQPDVKEIAVNAMAANSKYIPISFIQMKLDKLFIGLWHTENFRYSVVANEICGIIDLKVFHPIAKVWITRTGSASVMIMQTKGAEISDINAKIKNTLQKDLPHLMASCISSAAKTFGAWFGRDLNRKEVDEYQSFYTDMAKAEAAKDAIDWNKVKTKADLKKVWDAHSDLHNNTQFKKEFTYRKSQIAA